MLTSPGKHRLEAGRRHARPLAKGQRDGIAARPERGDAPRYAEHGQRGDERLDMELGGDEAVDDADEPAQGQHQRAPSGPCRSP